MSNRGRQNVASFLTKDCQIDWRLGAEFFESHLIDFEVRPLLLPVTSRSLADRLRPFCSRRATGASESDSFSLRPDRSEPALTSPSLLSPQLAVRERRRQRPSSVEAVQPDQAGQRRASLSRSLSLSPSRRQRLTLSLDLQYDPQGDYIRAWLPQLAKVPTQRIQCPWTMQPSDRSKAIPADSYPARPVLEQSTWKSHYNRKGPNKHGVPNRSERVRNPGPAALRHGGHGGQQGGGGGGGKKHGGAAGGGNAQHSGGSQPSLESRERESRVATHVLEEAKKHGQSLPNAKESVA